MATAANQTQQAVDTIRGIQSTMNNQQEALQAGWKGEASTAFTNAFMTFNGDFTKVLQALANLQEKLSAAQRNYTATETANTQAASKIGQALNG
ncbi:MAG TPA: WXG100 family type VII secretion target [Streptosporangiaceae bacterium]|jgi:WXG100 family type VII secretion target|nr:WXG100 family type VII secretion target [Streptosporangiaceae bacterium]